MVIQRIRQLPERPPRAAAPGGLHALPLVAVSLGYFMVILDATIVTVALPALGRDLGSNVTGLQWVVDAYTLAFAGLLLLGGSLGDRWGSRAVFQSALVAFTLASVACGLAPSLGTLVAARAVQGAGAAALVPSSLALLQAAYPDRRDRARAFGVWGGIAGVAAASGPVLGGVLTASISWRAVFLVAVPPPDALGRHRRRAAAEPRLLRPAVRDEPVPAARQAPVAAAGRDRAAAGGAGRVRRLPAVRARHRAGGPAPADGRRDGAGRARLRRAGAGAAGHAVPAAGAADGRRRVRHLVHHARGHRGGDGRRPRRPWRARLRGAQREPPTRRRRRRGAARRAGGGGPPVHRRHAPRHAGRRGGVRRRGGALLGDGPLTGR